MRRAAHRPGRARRVADIGSVDIRSLDVGCRRCPAGASTAPAGSSVTPATPPTGASITVAKDPTQPAGSGALIAKPSATAGSYPVFTYEWDWSDGDDSQLTTSYAADSGGQIGHAYPQGTWRITMTPGDTQYTYGAPATRWVTIPIDRTATRLEETSTKVAYSTGWALGTCTTAVACSADHQQKYSTASGSTATLTFTGTGADWLGSRGPNTGTAQVYLDGKLVYTIDTANPVIWDGVTEYNSPKLALGQHTLKIKTTSTKRVSIDFFTVHS